MQQRSYRDDSWLRSKPLGEKWPRFCAEIPPELADVLDAAQHKSLGVNQSAAGRANLVRSALRLYLNTVDPPPPDAIEGTAYEVIDLPALGRGLLSEEEWTWD